MILCDSTIAKQITWFEDYAKKRNNKSKNYLMLALEPFLHSFTTAVEAYIAMVSISYDIATNKAYTHMTLWLTRSHTYKKITKTEVTKINQKVSIDSERKMFNY